MDHVRRYPRHLTEVLDELQSPESRRFVGHHRNVCSAGVAECTDEIVLIFFLSLWNEWEKLCRAEEYCILSATQNHEGPPMSQLRWLEIEMPMPLLANVIRNEEELRSSDLPGLWPGCRLHPGYLPPLFCLRVRATCASTPKCHILESRYGDPHNTANRCSRGYIMQS